MTTAAERIRAALDAADAGGYGARAWYSYIPRSDIEAVLREAERVPALEAGLKAWASVPLRTGRIIHGDAVVCDCGYPAAGGLCDCGRSS